MNLSPTVRSYIIMFFGGLLLVLLPILQTQMAAHPDGSIDWRQLGWALAGGAIAFCIDFLKNNLGAFLEKPAPDVVQTGVARGGSQVLVPPAAQAPVVTTTNPPTA